MTGSPIRLGVVCYPTVGGSSVVAIEIAIHAASLGHEVHVLSYDRPHRLRGNVPGLRFHPVRVAPYPLLRFPPYDLALASRMLEVKEESGIDLFHVHYAIPHAVSACLARAMTKDRFRFVTTLHGTDITVVGADPAYMRPTRYALEESDAITAVSTFLADETRLMFGTRRPIEVIHNFVNTALYVPGTAGRWYERGDEERIIVHASNFRPVKRAADVVRAFAVIAKEVPARLLLVGEGPDLDHALAVAADVGVVNRVETIANQTSLEAIFADADLCLMASETESFGLTLLEAMSCGVPCATTDVGGVREVLGDLGAYAPSAQPDKLGRAALTLLRDADLHRARGTACRARAIAKFEQSQILELYYKVYRDTLNKA